MFRILFNLLRLYNIQFIISFIIGWLVLGEFWNSYVYKTSVHEGELLLSSKQCSCPRLDCDACKPSEEIYKDIVKQNEKIANGYFRTYRYKSQSANEDELNRWRLLTKKHNYEMINDQPRIGINGMWKEEWNKVDNKANEFFQSQSVMWKMNDMYRHYDPFHGIDYIVNYMNKEIPVLRTVDLWRSFVPGKPRLVSIEYAANDKLINIICPISKVSERFHKFLNRYENNVVKDISSGPVRLLFVIFRTSEHNSNEETTGHIVASLNQFKKNNPSAHIDYLYEEGEFSRAVGIDSGVKHCKNDEIVLFLDVDLKIGSGFLGRVRRNTIRGKRVIFPIMYSQYDPDVMDKATFINPELKSLTHEKLAINKETGFWIFYAFGVAAMYKSDYLKVGGFRLDIKGWGGEDVDLFKKMVADQDIEVMSMVDKDLIHIYHSRGCDPTLSPDQYNMCVGAASETIGSRIQVATLHIEDHLEEL